MHATISLHRTALIALVVLAACGDDDPPAPPGTLSLTVTRPTLTITQGRSDTLTVSITRGGSFRGAVTLATTGAPTGATINFGANVIPENATSTPATITLVASVAPGSYPITVTATGTGLTAQTATITLTVVAAITPDFRVVSTRDTLTVLQGDSTSAFVRLTRTGGFNAPVSMTTGTLPAGVTTGYADTSLTADSTRLTVRARSTAAPGTYRVELRGTSGTTIRADTVSVIVAAPPDFTLAATPDSLSLQAGSSGQTTVRLTRFGGLRDTVRLTLTGAPAGVAATFADSALAGDTTRATIMTAPTTAPGSYLVGVQGTAGSRVRVDTLRLIVTAPPSLELSLSPTADSIAAKSGDTVRVLIRRTGFAGVVRVRADTLPAGVTATIDTAGTAGDTLRVPIAIDSTATAGTYTIRFVGSAPGVAPDTASYSLTVTAAAPLARRPTPLVPTQAWAMEPPAPPARTRRSRAMPRI